MITARSSRSSGRPAGALARAGAVALLVLVASAPPSAHRRDEYLQAARLAIDPDKVDLEIDLTAGIAVSDQILAEIDRDNDGSISAAEGHDYSDRFLRAIALDVDGIPLRVELVDTRLPAIETVRNGEGTLRVRAIASMPRLRAGRHHLRYRNDHRSDLGAYLANALVPTSDRVAIVSQRRDLDQRELVVDYGLGADAATESRQSAVTAVGGVLIVALLLWRRLKPEATGARSQGRGRR